ncbi:MAG: hypothetical protein ACRENE_00955, partial [Polyangiaceae bacterium]
MHALRIAAALCFVVGCSGGSGQNTLGLQCSGTAPTFSADVLPILQRSCSGGDGCHGTPTYAEIVNTSIGEDSCSASADDVVPYDIQRSYLLHKLTGIDMCPMTEQMPPG